MDTRQWGLVSQYDGQPLAGHGYASLSEAQAAIDQLYREFDEADREEGRSSEYRSCALWAVLEASETMPEVRLREGRMARPVVW